jgi:hypothetical protein
MEHHQFLFTAEWTSIAIASSPASCNSIAIAVAIRKRSQSLRGNSPKPHLLIATLDQNGVSRACILPHQVREFRIQASQPSGKKENIGNASYKENAAYFDIGRCARWGGHRLTHNSVGLEQQLGEYGLRQYSDG